MLLKTACVFTLATTVSIDQLAAAELPVPDSPAKETIKSNTTEPSTTNDAPIRQSSDINHMQALVEHQEAEHGAYSDVLSESVFSLGTALQKEGKHQQAIDSFEHAMHINRVNNGIYSISQEAALRAIIDSQQAMDNNIKMGVSYDRLLRLYGRHYGNSSPELLPVLDEISSWHRSSYLSNPSRDAVGLLLSSLSLINTAITITELHPASSNKQKVNLLKSSIVNNWYLQKHFKRYQSFSTSDGKPHYAKQLTGPEKTAAVSAYNTPARVIQDAYFHGRDAYEQIIAITNDSNASPREQAMVLIELGDWFTLYQRPKSARDNYTKAWHLLNDSGDQQGLQELLGSADELPNFKPGFRSSGSLVRISMTIASNGRAKNFKVLKTYPENDKSAANKAIRSLQKTFFRPRYVDGQPTAHEGYTINLRLRK